MGIERDDIPSSCTHKNLLDGSGLVVAAEGVDGWLRRKRERERRASESLPREREREEEEEEEEIEKKNLSTVEGVLHKNGAHGR